MNKSALPKWTVRTHATGEVVVEAYEHWVTPSGDLILGSKPSQHVHAFARGEWVSVILVTEPS